MPLQGRKRLQHPTKGAALGYDVLGLQPKGRNFLPMQKSGFNGLLIRDAKPLKWLVFRTAMSTCLKAGVNERDFNRTSLFDHVLRQFIRLLAPSWENR
jgi:hypothetical protein